MTILNPLDRVLDNILRGLRRDDACIFESSGADKSELVDWLRRVGHGRSTRRVYGCCRDTHREHSVGRQGQCTKGASSFGWQRMLGEAVAPTLGRYEEWLRFQAGGNVVLRQPVRVGDVTELVGSTKIDMLIPLACRKDVVHFSVQVCVSKLVVVNHEELLSGAMVSKNHSVDDDVAHSGVDYMDYVVLGAVFRTALSTP